MPISRFSRCFCVSILVMLFFVAVTPSTYAVELGKRVFNSELANEIAFAENFHGKANLIIATNADANWKSEVQSLAKEFERKYNTKVVWRTRSEREEKGFTIIDKSGYMRQSRFQLSRNLRIPKQWTSLYLPIRVPLSMKPMES